jgi:hypothetical protein
MHMGLAQRHFVVVGQVICQLRMEGQPFEQLSAVHTCALEGLSINMMGLWRCIDHLHLGPHTREAPATPQPLAQPPSTLLYALFSCQLFNTHDNYVNYAYHRFYDP